MSKKKQQVHIYEEYYDYPSDSFLREPIVKTLLVKSNKNIEIQSKHHKRHSPKSSTQSTQSTFIDESCDIDHFLRLTCEPNAKLSKQIKKIIKHLANIIDNILLLTTTLTVMTCLDDTEDLCNEILKQYCDLLKLVNFDCPSHVIFYMLCPIQYYYNIFKTITTNNFENHKASNVLKKINSNQKDILQILNQFHKHLSLI